MDGWIKEWARTNAGWFTCLTRVRVTIPERGMMMRECTRACTCQNSFPANGHYPSMMGGTS